MTNCFLVTILLKQRNSTIKKDSHITNGFLITIVPRGETASFII